MSIMTDRFDEATQVRVSGLQKTIYELECYQKELATFLDKEQAQARVNSAIHNFTSICWDK